MQYYLNTSYSYIEVYPALYNIFTICTSCSTHTHIHLFQRVREENCVRLLEKVKSGHSQGVALRAISADRYCRLDVTKTKTAAATSQAYKMNTPLYNHPLHTYTILYIYNSLINGNIQNRMYLQRTYTHIYTHSYISVYITEKRSKSFAPIAE